MAQIRFIIEEKGSQLIYDRLFIDNFIQWLFLPWRPVCFSYFTYAPQIFYGIRNKWRNK